MLKTRRERRNPKSKSRAETLIYETEKEHEELESSLSEEEEFDISMTGDESVQGSEAEQYR